MQKIRGQEQKIANVIWIIFFNLINSLISGSRDFIYQPIIFIH